MQISYFNSFCLFSYAAPAALNNSTAV